MKLSIVITWLVWHVNFNIELCFPQIWAFFLSKNFSWPKKHVGWEKVHIVFMLIFFQIYIFHFISKTKSLDVIWVAFWEQMNIHKDCNVSCFYFRLGELILILNKKVNCQSSWKQIEKLKNSSLEQNSCFELRIFSLNFFCFHHHFQYSTFLEIQLNHRTSDRSCYFFLIIIRLFQKHISQLASNYLWKKFGKLNAAAQCKGHPF